MDGKRLLRNILRWRGALPVPAAVCAGYAAFLHPWLMNWGATPAEQRMSPLAWSRPHMRPAVLHPGGIS